MRQYVVDTLQPEDYRRLKKALDTRFGIPLVGGVYWAELPEALSTPIQSEHAACSPHVVALDLEETRLTCEFLVRTRKAMHCSCMGYASGEQRRWIMDMVDALLEDACVTA
ncbi:hypothetical protein LZ24_00044 [Desulfobotulus alkaliphilus]|uniref:Uncharacterized protein n=1 Tax=Desulfobotulus alkaliphilus TaxID=622671 RepID=A0A562S924_9BACT|nr:hypothetical protein [Desulfobotulus alkaliphilus]TWI77244.1 hypothetical protein LZ24_00044 [Desulfobotulus alkaliphilus]